MVQLKNISYFHNEKPVLKDFSLTINSDETVCFLGSSGCGKTTILRLIAGLEVPLKGKIIINNKIVSESGKLLVAPYERYVGFVFQDLALWPHFTIYKNIAFGLIESKKFDKSITKQKVDNILKLLGIEKQIDKYPHQLSGGQKQLVAIARALVLEPKILLLDEPLSNLDIKLKHKILNYIKQIKKQFSLTIIYVTHDHKEAFALADKIVVINKGKIEEKGTVEQIKSSKNTYVKYFLEY